MHSHVSACTCAAIHILHIHTQNQKEKESHTEEHTPTIVNTREMDAGDSVQGYLQLHSKFQAIMDYIHEPCPRKSNQTNQTIQENQLLRVFWY